MNRSKSTGHGGGGYPNIHAAKQPIKRGYPNIYASKKQENNEPETVSATKSEPTEQDKEDVDDDNDIFLESV